MYCKHVSVKFKPDVNNRSSMRVKPELVYVKLCCIRVNDMLEGTMYCIGWCMTSLLKSGMRAVQIPPTPGLFSAQPPTKRVFFEAHTSEFLDSLVTLSIAVMQFATGKLHYCYKKYIIIFFDLTTSKLCFRVYKHKASR